METELVKYFLSEDSGYFQDLNPLRTFEHKLNIFLFIDLRLFHQQRGISIDPGDDSNLIISK